MIQWSYHFNYGHLYLKELNVLKKVEIRLNQKLLLVNTFKNAN